MICQENYVLNLPTDDGLKKNEKRMFPSYGNISSKWLTKQILKQRFRSENQINVHAYKNKKVNKKPSTKQSSYVFKLTDSEFFKIHNKILYLNPLTAQNDKTEFVFIFHGSNKKDFKMWKYPSFSGIPKPFLENVLPNMTVCHKKYQAEHALLDNKNKPN